MKEGKEMIGRKTETIEERIIKIMATASKSVYNKLRAFIIQFT